MSARDPLWQRIHAEVTDLRPRDAREVDARRRILECLAVLPAPFDRSAGRTHFTASAIVLGRRGVVLHLHKRINRWLQPGGHIEIAETPWAAALREAREETGLTVALRGEGIVHVDVHPAPPDHVHLDLRYLVDAADGEPEPAQGESPQVRWFDWDEALAIADPGLLGALRALRSGALAEDLRAREARPDHEGGGHQRPEPHRHLGTEKSGQ